MSGISIVSQALGGMERSMHRLETASVKIAQGEVEPQQLATLVQEPVIYAANAQVVQSYDQVVGHVLQSYG